MQSLLSLDSIFNVRLQPSQCTLPLVEIGSRDLVPQINLPKLCDYFFVQSWHLPAFPLCKIFESVDTTVIGVSLLFGLHILDM